MGKKDKDSLTPKEALFVAEYLKDKNATRAYMRAFDCAKPNSAAVLADRLLKKVKVRTALDAALEEQRKRVEWSADDVLRQLKRMVHFDIREAFDANGKMLKPKDLPDDLALVIAGLEVEALYEGAGQDRFQAGEIHKFKLPDRNVALQNAMKHFGMLKEKVEVEAGESLRELLEKAHAQLEPES